MPNEMLCILRFIYGRKFSFRPNLACFLALLWSVTFLLKADAPAYGSNAGQQSADMRPLALGIPVERALMSGETHSYQIALAADQYLQVEVTQRGVSVILGVFDPTGKKLTEADNAKGKQGSELLTDVGLLEPGKRIERELAGGRSHSYQFMLASGQYAQVLVQQKGINVVVKLFGPDGKPVAEVDSSSGTQGAEPVYWIAEAAGSYRLEVSSLKKEAKAGQYEVKLAELRAPTQQDEDRVAAQKAFAEGERLSGQGTKASREAAIKKYEEALSIHRAAVDRVAEATTLQRLGNLYNDLGELRKALDYYNQALPMWQAIGDRHEEATVLKSIGSVFEGLGERGKALERYSQALILFRAVNDRGAEAVTLSGMGVVYRLLGEPQKALEYYNQALPLHRAVGDKHGEAQTLQNIGVVYKVTNEIQKALEYFRQALLMSRAVKDQQLEAMTLANISDVYRILVEPEKALEYSNQALPLWRLVGDRRGEAMTLQVLGSTYYKLGEWQKALEYYSRTLPLDRAVGDRFGEALILMRIGTVYYELGKPQKALEYYNQALPLMRAVGNREAQGALLQKLGDVYRRLGELPKALEYYNSALPLQHAENARIGEANTLAAIAAVERDQGKLSQARVTIEKAFALLEFVRAGAGSQENRSSFLAAVSYFYEFDIDLLVRMHAADPQAGHDLTALTISEQARARSLLEILAEAYTDIRQGVDAQLLERERSLKERITAKLDDLTKLLKGKHTDEQKAAAEREIDALTDDYRQAQAEIRERSPRYAALTQPQPLNVREIQQQVLDGNTILLEYALGSDHSFLWAVTTDRVLSYQLPPRAEIEALAKSVYQLLVARQPAPELTESQQRAREEAADARYLTQATALSRMLLGPVAAQLGTKRLLIVADGALQYLPFAALPAPGGDSKGGGHGNVIAGNNSNDLRTPSSRRPLPTFAPLLFEHEIVSLPSASVLAVLRRELAGRQPAVRMVAVLADPVFSNDDARVKLSRASRKSSGGTQNQTAETIATPSDSSSRLERAIRSMRGDSDRAGLRRLLFSRDEAEAIMSVTPQPLGLKALDFRANRPLAVSDELSHYRVIHFATHGLLDSKNPEMSGLVLSLVDEAGRPQEGFLRLHEIYNLRLNADLVVLSACQTGLGKEVRGEGLIGLTRGFMYAGAPRVMASLWQVDDAATAELMKRFYRGMMQEKLPPAAALRAAQIELIKKKHWQSPYYWGAFVIQGEWR